MPGSVTRRRRREKWKTDGKKKMYGQYVRDMTEVDWERTWQWLLKETLGNVWEG